MTDPPRSHVWDPGRGQVKIIVCYAAILQLVRVGNIDDDDEDDDDEDDDEIFQEEDDKNNQSKRLRLA